MNQFETRNIKVLGISRDSTQSHRHFIAKQGLINVTLLTDEKGDVIKMYGASHTLLPVSKRVYIIVDKQMRIVYRMDTGFDLLPDQTQALIGEIDRHIP